MNKKKKILLITFLAILFIIYIIGQSRFFNNLLMSLVEKGEYYIPDESNYFDFEVLEMNNGSGDWWVYAMDDDNYYYYQHTSPDIKYTVYPKSYIKSCYDFNGLDFNTWCNFVYDESKEEQIENTSNNNQEKAVIDPKFGFLESIDPNIFEVNNSTIYLKVSSKSITVSLEPSEKINRVYQSPNKKLLSVVIGGVENIMQGRVVIIDINTQEVIKSITAGEKFILPDTIEEEIGYIYSAMFSNDSKYVYLSYTYGGSGAASSIFDLTIDTLVGVIPGSVIAVLPEKENISSDSHKKYANQLLVGRSHYYIIGGRITFIDIFNPQTLKVEDEGILSEELGIEGIETFYNMYIF